MEESAVYTLHKLVFALDRSADKLLQAEFGISHKRALFLVMLQSGPLTQHQLAEKLGYTDPAVSSMLSTLVESKYITISPDPTHLRKNIVALTAKGQELVGKARVLLDAKFERLLESAGVANEQYSNLTERIYNALMHHKKVSK